MSLHSNTKNFFATNLLQLQNFIKRDPTSYKDEFLQTFHNYESTLQMYLMKPSKSNRQLADLAMFLSHVSHCYSDELSEYPQQLIDILKKYATVLNPEMRLSFCKCLMLIRSKNLIEPLVLFQTFFMLIRCQDKLLRKTLYDYMLNDVKRIKTKLKNHKLCTQIQQYVFTLTKDVHGMIAKYALNLLIDLYKKHVWDDAKTVNVIASCCFCKTTKVMSLALQFFAGKDADKDSDDESDSDGEEKASAQQILLGLRVGKKTKSRQKKSDRALRAIRKEKKSKKRTSNGGLPHFSAINLIYDAHDFAEKLFKLVETTNEGFEIKLSILDLIARLIGIHSLFLLNFHSFLIRFLNPHQREVTKMLWFAAISSHELTPPDTVEPLLMSIANNFITERNNSEVIAVGLNSIREICARCPLAMSEDLLGDLVQYNTYKDKAVSTAAKSLIQLFREKNPQLLQRKMRGKPTEASVVESGRVKVYGEVESLSYVPGAEVIDDEDSTVKTTKQASATKKRKLNDKRDEDEETKDDDDDEDDGDEDDVDKNGEEDKEGEWVETSDDEEEEEEEDDEDDEEEEEDETGNNSGKSEIKKKQDFRSRSKKRKHESEDDDDEDDDENESDGDWVNVSDEEDALIKSEESGAANDAASLMTLEEKAEKAAKVSSEKILTQEDFKRIRLEQLKKKVTDKNFAKSASKKKTISIDTDSEAEQDEKIKNNGLVPLSSITYINKKKKQDREARMAKVMEGRKGREKFGHRFKDSRLGKTNKEKTKNKSFMMIRHKANKKQKRSFKDKQVALRASLLKQKKMK